jgi:hypothetical protein
MMDETDKSISADVPALRDEMKPRLRTEKFGFISN